MTPEEKCVKEIETLINEMVNGSFKWVPSWATKSIMDLKIIHKYAIKIMDISKNYVESKIKESKNSL